MQSPPKLDKSTFWQLLTWVIDPVKFFKTVAGQHPDLCEVKTIGFGNEYILVNHPEAIKEILSSNRQKLFASSKNNSVLKPLVGDRSITLLEGDPHRQRRKLLMPPFHGARMATYGQSIIELTNTAFSGLSAGETFSARDLTQDISLQVILQVVYGISKSDAAHSPYRGKVPSERWSISSVRRQAQGNAHQDSDRARQLKGLMTKMTDTFNSPLTSTMLFFPWLQQDWGAWSPWGYFVKVRKAIDELIYAEIAERRQDNTYGEDILSMLMSARDEAGEAIGDLELRDELMSLMFAGHETTATAIAWALYWVHYLPEVKAKLLAEIASLGTSPEPMEIAKLPYLDAVCKETLRIHPVAMLTFARVVQQPMQLLGYDLEPGKVLMGNIFSVHQREDIYPHPQQFKPERFLEREFTGGEFIPFGGGARRCIGEALANFELKLVLATVVSSYQLTLASDIPEKPQRRGITLSPAGGVKMRFENTQPFTLKEEGDLIVQN